MTTLAAKHPKVTKAWRKLLCSLPGYDPFAQAEGCWFDAEKAQYYIDFIETCCTHIEGALAGKPFLLESWQRAIMANAFGWHRRDFLDRIVRRYRKAFVYVPRKNGKTPFVAAIHNCCFFLDDEAGQINNLAAASRDQASKLFRHIKGMIEREPEMSARCTIYKSESMRTIVKPDSSVTKVIPADDSVAHGDNPHFQAIDEVHAQPNRRLYDALTSAMSSANRIQPMLWMITTADFDRVSVCNSEYAYACKVRDNKGDKNQPGYDPSYLPVIYEATKDEDWTSEEIWYKANPNLGISKSLDYMRSECKRAKEDAMDENKFKRLELNIITEQSERCIQMDAWDRCNAAPIMAIGQPVWVGLDIGAIRDLCALVLLWQNDEGEPITVEYEDMRGDKQRISFVRHTYSLQPYFWLPEKPVSRNPRAEDDIRAWKQQGFIRTTPGDVVDYDCVAADITRILQPYALQQLAIDQGFQGIAITQTLQKVYGERVVAFRQGILSMAAPCRELMEMIQAGRLRHGGHPVLRWMASNVAAETRGGLIKFSKDKSSEKIDGMTALAMALGVAMTAQEQKGSVYETRGITVIGDED